MFKINNYKLLTPTIMKHFFVTTLFVLVNIAAVCQDNVYHYPIQPSSPEWKSLTTTQDRIDACDIPQSYLEKANTADLLISCLNNPLLFEVTASNSFLVGMNNLRTQVKAFQVLTQRNDYKQVLLDYYRLTNPKSIMYITDDLSKFKYSLKYLYVELLLADKALLQSLTDQERKDLAQQLLIKFEEKSQLSDNYRYFGTIGSLLGLAQLLLVNNQKGNSSLSNTLDSNKINQLLDNQVGYNIELSNYVLQEAHKIIK